MKLDKNSIESDIQATSREFDSVSKRFSEVSENSIDLKAAKSAANEAEIRLQVLTVEHVVTSASLNAVSSDHIRVLNLSKHKLKKKIINIIWKYVYNLYPTNYRLYELSFLINV